MGWYYCTSERVIPVPVGNGEVVGVRPYSHVFIDSRMEGRGEVRRYVSIGHLQRCGNPGKGAVKAIPAQPIAQKDTSGSGETAFSDSIVAEAKISKMKPVPGSEKVSTPEDRAASAAKAKGQVADAAEKPKRGRRKTKAKPPEAS